MITSTTVEATYSELMDLATALATKINAKADASDLDSYELKANVTSKGAADTPVYFDANGVATPITSYAGKAATAGVADSANAVAWDNVSDTPTTLAGYGITDAQAALTFDNAPTADSDNPVKSGGVYTALSAKANTADLDSNTTATSGQVVTAISMTDGVLSQTTADPLSVTNYTKQGVDQGAGKYALTAIADSNNNITGYAWELIERAE